MRSLVALLFIIVLTTGCKSFCSDYSDQNVRNKTDNSFMASAAYYDLDAMDIAKLAIARSSNTSIISFADTVVNNCQTAYSELQQLSIGADLLPPSPDNNEQSIKPQLTSLSGRDFDSAYVQYQSHALASIIAAFNNEIANGQYSYIKDYAVKYEPILLQEQQQLSQTGNETL